MCNFVAKVFKYAEITLETNCYELQKCFVKIELSDCLLEHYDGMLDRN